MDFSNHDLAHTLSCMQLPVTLVDLFLRAQYQTPSHQVPGLNATAVLPQDQAGGVSQQRTGDGLRGAAASAGTGNGGAQGGVAVGHSGPESDPQTESDEDPNEGMIYAQETGVNKRCSAAVALAELEACSGSSAREYFGHWRLPTGGSPAATVVDCILAAEGGLVSPLFFICCISPFI